MFQTAGFTQVEKVGRVVCGEEGGGGRGTLAYTVKSISVSLLKYTFNYHFIPGLLGKSTKNQV